MLLSMTGYGRASRTYGDKTVTIELRSLNTKYMDIRFKMPQNYREKEGIFRRLITERVHRGKVDFVLDLTSIGGDDQYSLNRTLFKKYYSELKSLTEELEMPAADMMQAILRIPNVIVSEEGTVDEREWAEVQATLKDALVKFTEFRATEGAAMGKDMEQRILLIQNAVKEIAPFEEERAVNLRQRLRQRLDDYMNKDNVDENRFEQELLFYLEKMDLTEERVRLEQHCKFFLEELARKKESKGRKLNFISQEIGREINTMGAKAYSSDIQRLVVVMKDELEKIKEQVANLV